MFSSLEYQKLAVNILHTSKPTSADQAKRPIKALYEKYTAWVSQAAQHFKTRHLALLEDKSSLPKLFDEIEDARRHPAITTQVVDKVILSKKVADLASEELKGQKELKRPAGDELGQEKPQEFLGSLSYRNRDPRLQPAAVAAGGQEPPAKRLCLTEGEPVKQEGDLRLDEVIAAGVAAGVFTDDLCFLPASEGSLTPQSPPPQEGLPLVPSEAAEGETVHEDYRDLFDQLSPTSTSA